MSEFDKGKGRHMGIYNTDQERKPKIIYMELYKLEMYDRKWLKKVFGLWRD
jgi:hypothetical protein